MPIEEGVVPKSLDSKPICAPKLPPEIDGRAVCVNRYLERPEGETSAPPLEWPND